jgi:hypothetical protein
MQPHLRGRLEQSPIEHEAILLALSQSDSGRSGGACSHVAVQGEKITTCSTISATRSSWTRYLGTEQMSALPLTR